MVQCSHRNHVEEGSAKNQFSLLVSEQKGDGANGGVLILAPHVTFCPKAWGWHCLEKLFSPGDGSDLSLSVLPGAWLRGSQPGLPSNPLLTAVIMSRFVEVTSRICQDKLPPSTVLTACCCLGATAQGGWPWCKGWHFGKVWGGFCSPGITFVPCKPH